MKLKMSIVDDDTMKYRIAWSSRFIYLFFLVILFIGAVVSYADGSWSLSFFPVLLMLLLFGGAMYEESWRFSKKDDRVIYRIGLIFAAKKTVLEFSDIEQFEITYFRKGSRSVESKVKSRANRLYLTFSLVTLDGDRHDIEIMRVKGSAGRIEREAAAIAAFCGIPLVTEQTPEDEM